MKCFCCGHNNLIYTNNQCTYCKVDFDESRAAYENTFAGAVDKLCESFSQLWETIKNEFRKFQ